MSDIKMVGTMSESIQRIYKGSKKYKIQTGVYFENYLLLRNYFKKLFNQHFVLKNCY